jgi:oligopeptide transport system permease protein
MLAIFSSPHVCPQICCFTTPDQHFPYNYQDIVPAIRRCQFIIHSHIPDKGRVIEMWLQFKKNRPAVAALVFLFLLTAAALFAPWITPYGYEITNERNVRLRPFTGYDITTDHLEECHWAGTAIEWGCAFSLAGSDNTGRDLWSRLIYGARATLSVVAIASTTSLLFGGLYGSLAAYLGQHPFRPLRWLDFLMMRWTEFVYAFPPIIVAVLLRVFFNRALVEAGNEGLASMIAALNQRLHGLLFVWIAIALASWIGTARLVRQKLRRAREKETTAAAVETPTIPFRTTFRRALPDMTKVALAAEVINIPHYIYTEAAISFIGVGVYSPLPSWGSLIACCYAGVRSWPHLVFVPTVAFALTTMAFILVGDGLRNALRAGKE